MCAFAASLLGPKYCWDSIKSQWRWIDKLEPPFGNKTGTLGRCLPCKWSSSFLICLTSALRSLTSRLRSSVAWSCQWCWAGELLLWPSITHLLGNGIFFCAFQHLFQGVILQKIEIWSRILFKLQASKQQWGGLATKASTWRHYYLLNYPGLSWIMKSITSQYLNFMNVNQMFVQTWKFLRSAFHYWAAQFPRIAPWLFPYN